MADTDRHDTPAAAPKDETRGEARRNLNRTVAQRQKLLLAGIGGVALISGLSAITARGTSPWSLFGSGTTAASATAGCL